MSITKRLFEKSDANTEKKRPTGKVWKPTRKAATCVDCKKKLSWDYVVWGYDKKPLCYLCARDMSGKYMKGFTFCIGCEKLMEYGKSDFAWAWGIGFRSLCKKCRGNRHSVEIEEAVR